MEGYARAHEAKQRQREYAADCERRAREWSDLLAQQQSARAAVSSAQTAQAQIIWTILEIAALIATIWVGVVAIGTSKKNSDAALTKAEQHFALSRRAWVALYEPRVYLDRGDEIHKSLCVEFTVKNVGLSPAVHVNVVFLDGDDEPAPSESHLKELEEWIARARKGRPAGFALMPGQPHTDFVVTPFPQKIPADDSIVQFIRGFVRYELADGTGRPHFTPFVWLVHTYFDEQGKFKESEFRPFILHLGPD